MSAIEVALHRDRRIPAAAVLRLYEEAGWWPERDAARVDEVLASAPAAGAWDGERVVAFARAVSDGAFRAFLEDVVVAREYRRRGLASALVGLLLAELRGVATVTTFCDERLVGLYEAAGFRPTSQVVLHLALAAEPRRGT